VPKDPAREIARYLADDATWDQRVEHALRTQANGLSALAGEVKTLAVIVRALPKQIEESAAESRRYYRGLQERMDAELGNEWDDITGSQDTRSLRDAGRTWRNKAREAEAAAAAAEAEKRASERAAEERAKKLKQWGALAGIFLAGAGGAIWELIERAVGK